MHNRQSVRLKDYDYSSSGAYFITICTFDKNILFGNIVDGEMKLNEYGEIVNICWKDLKNRFQNIELEQYVIMPDHFHGIILINDYELHIGGDCRKTNIDMCRGNPCGCPRCEPTQNNEIGRAQGQPLQNNECGRAQGSIPQIVGAFKSITTNEIIKEVKINNLKPFNKHVWQRNYYEHIIRNEIHLKKIREYILNNPICWDVECEHDEFKNIIGYL